MNTLARRLVSVLAVVLAVCVAASAAEPVIDIPESAAQDALQDTHRKQIDDYVAYHIGKMVSSTTQESVIAARSKLTGVGGYLRYGRASEYMSAYGASVATHGKDMLTKLASDDPLSDLKEVNLAIIASRVQQVSLQPLVAAMVLHGNPAVRFFGWQTYALIRTQVLTVGGKVSQAMYTSLANAMVKEQDPHVLAEMLKMFRLPRETDGDDAYREGQSKLFNVLKENWISLCRRVLKADGTVIEGANTGVVAAVRLKGALGKELGDKEVIQMVANMTWSAGKAYDLALQVQEAAEAAALAKKENERATMDPSEANLSAANLAGQNAKQLAAKVGKKIDDLASQVSQSEYAVSTSRLLLRECERSLNTLTGRNDSHISKPLKARGSSDPAASVRIGVMNWVDSLVDKNGIKRPETLVPAKTPTPLK